MRTTPLTLLALILLTSPLMAQQPQARFYTANAVIVGDILGKTPAEAKLKLNAPKADPTARKYDLYRMDGVTGPAFGYAAMGVELSPDGRIKEVRLAANKSTKLIDAAEKAAIAAGGVKQDDGRYLVGKGQRYYVTLKQRETMTQIVVTAHYGDWIIAADKLTGDTAKAILDGKPQVGMTIEQVKGAMGREPDYIGKQGLGKHQGGDRIEWNTRITPGGMLATTYVAYFLNGKLVELEFKDQRAAQKK